MIKETYVVHITKECNMDCKYCYEKDKTSIYKWEEIQYLLDNIIKYNKDFNLEFLGGEPVLRHDYIIKTVEYLKDKNINTNFMITTNGTLLPQDLIDYLKVNKNITWHASMDGNTVANFLRITKDGYNSHDLVIQNHKKLEQEIGIDRIGIHMITHPFNIAYFRDSIEHLYENGIRSIGVGIVESTLEIGREFCLEYIKQHDQVSKEIIQNKYPHISISSFDYLKPRTDQRHYVRDETGKVILETYGRVKDDILTDENFKTPPASSPIGDVIVDLRELVYKRHHKRLSVYKKTGELI